MIVNPSTSCDVARTADAAAAPLRAAGITVTTAGVWNAPLAIGSAHDIQARIAAMLLAVVDETRLAARDRRDGAASDVQPHEVVSVRATTTPAAPGMLQVTVACGSAARELTLPVLTAILL